MFSSIKLYIYSAIGVIFAILLGVIKYLSFVNKEKKVEIDTLNNNAEQAKQEVKDSVKHAEFEAKYKAEAKQANDDSVTDSLDKRKKDEKVNPDFVSVTV